MGRFSQFSVAASVMALADAGLTGYTGDGLGVVVHTGAGGLIEAEGAAGPAAARPTRVSPFFVPVYGANMAACQPSIVLGATGPVLGGVGRVRGRGAGGDRRPAHARAGRRRGGAGRGHRRRPVAAAAGLAGERGRAGAGGRRSVLRLPALRRRRAGMVASEGAAIFVLERLDRAQGRGAPDAGGGGRRRERGRRPPRRRPPSRGTRGGRGHGAGPGRRGGGAGRGRRPRRPRHGHAPGRRCRGPGPAGRVRRRPRPGRHRPQVGSRPRAGGGGGLRRDGGRPRPPPPRPARHPRPRPRPRRPRLRPRPRDGVPPTGPRCGRCWSTPPGSGARTRPSCCGERKGDHRAPRQGMHVPHRLRPAPGTGRRPPVRGDGAARPLRAPADDQAGETAPRVRVVVTGMGCVSPVGHDRRVDVGRPAPRAQRHHPDHRLRPVRPALADGGGGEGVRPGCASRSQGGPAHQPAGAAGGGRGPGGGDRQRHRPRTHRRRGGGDHRLGGRGVGPVRERGPGLRPGRLPAGLGLRRRGHARRHAGGDGGGRRRRPGSQLRHRQRLRVGRPRHRRGRRADPPGRRGGGPGRGHRVLHHAGGDGHVLRDRGPVPPQRRSRGRLPALRP